MLTAAFQVLLLLIQEMALGQKNPRGETQKLLNLELFGEVFHLYVFTLRLDLCEYNGLDVITACFAVLPALVASHAPRIGLAHTHPEHTGRDYRMG